MKTVKRPMGSMYFFCLLASALCLTACAGSSTRPPTRVQTAIEANNRAVAALARADYPAAERFYLQAIEHERAIENTDGIALNLIGLAVSYQSAGQEDEALRIATRLLTPQAPPLTSARRAEAALLLSAMQIGRTNWREAAESLALAEAECPPDNCPLYGRLLNVQAQLAIVGNRLDAAAKLAAQAAQLAVESGDAEEEANALRTLANSRLFSQPAAALPVIERALSIDKQLALSRKIVKDLLLYGRLQHAAGQLAAARQLYARARSVAQADHNSAALREIDRFELELKAEGEP